ncbi:MAG TPA: HNH endonuclease [Anaeromyxobacteraceae bacterium]
MHTSAPSSLDSAALARRLGELAGHERAVQVEFLLHLAEFDTRRAWAEAGYGSLWDYLLRVVHLREGAAFRRMAAMRVVRRLPVVAEALRDGRLCLSTAAVLEKLLTEENVAELIARAAFLTKAQVEKLAVTIQPRTAPKDGLRLLPSKPAPRETQAPVAEPPTPAVSVAPAPPTTAALPLAPPPSGATLEPVSDDTYSLRVTVDAALEKDIEELRALLSHKIPNGELSEVLREAVQCALEKHRKRKGAAEPSRKRKSPVAAKAAKKPVGGREPISAAVRREVWARDEGRCTWCGPDGRRCGSTWQVELDHILPAALGGPSTVENLRILCRAHNTLSAEQVFGREHMELFRSPSTRTGEITSPSGSGSAVRPPWASDSAASLPTLGQEAPANLSGRPPDGIEVSSTSWPSDCGDQERLCCER